MTITAHSDLSLEPVMAREVRMLMTLLAGCDPCGYVEQGRSPNLYAGMALDALFRLERPPAAMSPSVASGRSVRESHGPTAPLGSCQVRKSVDMFDPPAVLVSGM